jgi:hypothetical protein
VRYDGGDDQSLLSHLLGHALQRFGLLVGLACCEDLLKVLQLPSYQFSVILVGGFLVGSLLQVSYV